jgi:hypothetical protein
VVASFEVFFDPQDRIDLARDQSQQGVAGARAHLEDAFDATEPERRDRERHDVRLRDRLIAADRGWPVEVGQMGESGRHERLTGHDPERSRTRGSKMPRRASWTYTIRARS